MMREADQADAPADHPPRTVGEGQSPPHDSSLDSRALERRRRLWLLRAACFAQFFAFGILFCFEAVWMKDHGMGEFFIGWAVSLATALVLFSGLGWGILADASGRPDRIVVFGCFAVSAVLVLFSRCSAPAHFLIYAALRGVCVPMIWNMMPLLAVSVVEGRVEGRGYGNYRVFGSMGYVLGAMLMPRLFSDIRSLLVIAASTMLIAAIPLLFFKPVPRRARTHGRFRTIFSNRELVGFYIALFFFALASPSIYGFTTVYARKLGADNRFIGLLTGSMGAISVIALPAFGWAVDRFGPRRMLWLAFLAQPVRTLCLSLVTRYEFLLLPHLLHFFTFAGLEIAAVLLVARLARPGDRATAMSVYAGSQVLARMAGAPVAGYLAQNFGYPVMYRVSAALAAIGLVVFTVGMASRARRKQDVGNDASARR